MKSLSETKDTRLVWTQPKLLAKYYELKAGEDVVATLQVGRHVLSYAVGIVSLLLFFFLARVSISYVSWLAFFVLFPLIGFPLSFLLRKRISVIGKAYDGEWTFKHFGFLSSGINVRLQGSDIEVASFKRRRIGSGGTMQILLGHLPLTWKREGIRGEWAFAEADGTTPIKFVPSFHKREAADRLKPVGHSWFSYYIEIDPKARALSELSLLALLGLYLIVLSSQRN